MTDLQLEDRPEHPRFGRRQADLDGAPWPVKAIATLGGVTCIACFLVWVLAMDVKGEQKNHTKALQDHQQTTGQIGASIQNMENDHRASNRMIERILRQMCRQQAKTPADIERCDPVDNAGGR